MATDVDSRIGFQTAGAVAAINNLTKALGGYNNALLTMQKRAKAANAANQTLVNTNKQVSNTTNKAAKSMGGMQQQLNNTATGAKKASGSARELAFSWQAVTRIFALGIALQGLNALIGGLREGITTAKDFEIRIAEIKTLIRDVSDDAGRAVPGIDELRGSVLSLSNEFGRAADDVAEGLYESLSNQIADTGSEARDTAIAIGFMNDALAFSKATVATTEDSVNLLSSVLKSYNLDATQASRVSDILFTTIDKGRVRADELANTFGRTLPLAESLGVTFEEVAASVATLTVQGIKADEAQTLLINTFLKLLKPTTAMKQAFENLGVSSAEAGVAAFGFKGFLDELTESGDLTASEIAELTGRIRAARGVIGLTGEAAESFNATLKEMRESAGVTQEALDIIQGTDADKLNRELNEIQNSLTETGTNLLGVLATGAAAMNDLIDVGDLVAVSVALIGTTAVLALGTQLVNGAITGISALTGVEAAAIKARLSIASIGRASLILIAVLALLNARSRALANAYEEIELASDAATKTAEQGAQAVAAEQIEQSNKAFAVIFKNFGKIRRLYARDKAAAISAQRGITINLNREVDRRVSLIQKLVSEVEAVADNAAGNIRDLNEAARQFDLDVRLQQFERGIANLNPAAQGAALIAQAEAFRKAGQELAGSQDPEEQQRALDFLREANDFAQRAADISATRFQADKKILQVRQTFRNVTKQIVEIEKERKAEAERVAAELRVQADEVVGILTRLKEIQNTDPTKLTKEGVQDLAKEASNLQGRLQDALGEIDIGSLEGVRALAELRAEASKPFDFDIAGNIKDFADSLGKEIQGLSPEVRKGLEALDIQINPALGLDGIEASLIEAKKKVEEGANAIRPIARLRTQIETGDLKNLEVQLQELASTFEVFDDAALFNPITALASGAGIFDDEIALGNALQAKAQEIVEILNQDTDIISPEELLRAQKLINDFRTLSAQNVGGTPLQGLTGVGAAPSGQTGADVANTLEAILDKRSQIAEEAKKTQFADQTGAAAVAARLAAINQLSQAFQENVNQLNAIGPASVQSGETATNNINAIKTSAENAAAAVERLRGSLGFLGGVVPNVAGGTTSQNARGGLIPQYLAQGGFPGYPKGTDKIPAWLTKGEMVINPASTKKFFSQLQDINAGKQPIYRQDGGPVTNNTNIGDVTFNITTTKSVNGRQLASAFQREVRRRTIR